MKIGAPRTSGLRCPCCRGTGEGGFGWTYCPGCNGVGTVASVRQWLQAAKHPVGRIVGMLFLSAIAGGACSIPVTVTFGWLLLKLGVDVDPFVMTRAIAVAIALGFVCTCWLDEDKLSRRSAKVFEAVKLTAAFVWGICLIGFIVLLVAWSY